MGGKTCRTDGPKWERGFRRYGYWDGIKRLGLVSKPPGGPKEQKLHGFGWFSDVTGKEGRCKSFALAKRMVEQEAVKCSDASGDG